MTETEPTAEAEPAPTSPSAGDLSHDAALLEDRRARLAEVQAALADAERLKWTAIRGAEVAFGKTVSDAYKKFERVAEPLTAEEGELLTAVKVSEQAVAELDIRRQRVAELRAKLEAAESELPTD